MIWMRAFWARLGLLLAAAALVPACYDNSDSIAIHSSTVVFSDSFGGDYPGTQWTPPAGDGSAMIDSGSLLLSGLKNGDMITTETVLAFANPPLTMSLDMAASVADRGVLTVSVVDSSNAVVASMAWDTDSPSIDVEILGTVAVIPAPSADGTYHALSFEVDGAGAATWVLNGVDELTVAGLPAGDLKLRISATWGPGGGVDYLIDNVRVTIP